MKMKVLIKHKALLIAHRSHVQSSLDAVFSSGGGEERGGTGGGGVDDTLNSRFLPQSAVKACGLFMKDVCSATFFRNMHNST